MKGALLVVTAILAIVTRKFHIVDGLHLLGNKVEDGVLIMNAPNTTDESVLDNYCQSCKWGKPIVGHYTFIVNPINKYCGFA